MRQFFLPLLFLSLVFLTVAWSSGATQTSTNGYTGAPRSSGSGFEQRCGNCHGGGPYGEPIVDVVVSETAGGSAVGSYVPGTTYFVSVAVSPVSGTPVGYGFQTLFLDAPTSGTPQQAGVLSNPGTDAQISPANGRQYAEQSRRTPSGTWDFRWTAPMMGTGTVNIYAVGNAVNGANGTGGDRGSTTTTILTLAERTLPVELVAFSGRREKTGVALTWQTAAEDQTEAFIVERATDGTTFTPVGRLTAAGTSPTLTDYAFTDRAAPVGALLYRLRIQDFDGSHEFSDLLAVGDAAEPLFAFPNPATDRLQFSEELSSTARITVIGSNGRTVLSTVGERAISTHGLAPGTYTARVMDEGTVRTVRFVRQ